MIFIYLFVVVSAQVACIYHLFKYDRWMRWLMPLIFIPLASVAYFVIEILPDLLAYWKQSGKCRTLAPAADPYSELKKAQHALDQADSAANRLRLADAYSALGRHGDALPHYQRGALGRMDHRTGEKLARCQYLTDRNEEALATLDAMDQPNAASEKDRIALLRARIIEDLGRATEAEALYADLVDRLPGDEVRCRYAGLLLKQGRMADARRLLDEVEHRLKRRDRRHRAANDPMYDWAMAKLAELRA